MARDTAEDVNVNHLRLALLPLPDYCDSRACDASNLKTRNMAKRPNLLKLKLLLSLGWQFYYGEAIIN